MTKIGERVVAIRDANANEIHLFGCGVYAGDQIPPLGVTLWGISLHDEGISNPKIELDGGDVVWGCQCWWGPESGFDRKFIGDRAIIRVSIQRGEA